MNSSRSVKLAAEVAGCVAHGTIVRCDEPLAARTTLRVGGPADVYVEPVSETDLAAVVKLCRAQSVPVLLLGRGSNLLVRDGGFRGVVICLAQPAFTRIEVSGERVWCGAGARLKNVVAEAKRHTLGGLEFLDGIPGGVGGALRMNAGAMGAAIFDRVESVRCLDMAGNIVEKTRAELPVEYRACPWFRENLALAAVLRGEPATRESIDARLNEFNRRRWEAQPAKPSAGCTFKNPPTIPAGRLIDELGLKGLRVGGAMVSLEHGNFLVNEGGATAAEVLELIEQIRARARQERGIELHPEVEIVGESR